MILFPGLKDIVVNNQRRVSNSNSIGSYSRSRYNLSGVGNTKTTSMTVGDIVFIAEGKPYITFRQISDPHGLARVVKSIRKQQINVQIGGPIETKQELTQSTEFQISKGQTETSNNTVIISCNQCGNSNPKGSKFCNKCGSSYKLVALIVEILTLHSAINAVST
jgi:hypothetical protein